MGRTTQADLATISAGRRVSLAMVPVATIVALLWVAGCGPWITTIPTYWDPVDWVPAGDPLPPASAPPKIAIHPTPAPKPVDPDYDVPEDTPEECRAIYVVSAQNRLFAYKPQDDVFEERGILRCPGTRGATPFSMAVSRKGIASVVFVDGALFEVDVRDASCRRTTFRRRQHGFLRFGMGYAPSPKGPGETLYVAEMNFARPSLGLASIDTSSNTLSPIGAFSENPGFALELTPTGNGPLYGFFLNQPGPGGTLVQIDRTTANITKRIPLKVGTAASALAVSWFNGYFFIFTAASRRTLVTRYDPVEKLAKVVGSIGQTIVGAGVSTCAPDRQRGRGKKESGTPYR